MHTGTIRCTHCQNPLPVSLLNQPELEACPACESKFQVLTFPSLSLGLRQGSLSEPILAEGEASCYYHPDKRAVVPCHRCGRFLCGLCEMILNEEHLCPACLKSAEEKGSLAALDHRRILYDRMALLVALLPVLFLWPVTILTGPLAIGIGIYSLKKPAGLVEHFRFRAYLAMLFGFLETAAWIWGGIAVFS